MLPAFVTSLVAFTSVLSAAEDMQMRNLENRVSSLEQRRGNASGMINPAARPVVKDGVDLWFEGDALYMRASQDGLGYAITTPSTDAFVNGKTKSIRYNWNWGWRAAMGYNLPHDGWDIRFGWAWFKAHGKRVVRQDDGGVYPTENSPDGSLASPASTFRSISASGHASAIFNIADLDMGREFFVSKWLTLRPFVGIRGMWMNNNYKARYKGGSALGFSSIRDKLTNRFRGYGLHGGLDTQWGLGSGWSVFGDLAFSLLYGMQRTKANEAVFSGAGTVNRLKDNDRWQALRAITDFALGIRWDKLFSNDRYRMRLQLGWENHMFFDLSQSKKFVNTTVDGKFVANRGAMGLNGLAFRAQFDF